MDPSNVKDAVKDLATKLVSLDPVEFQSAINEYFEANAVLENKTLYIAGSSRIKKLAYLQSVLATKSKLSGEPSYDEADNIVSLSFERTFQAPSLPSYIPLANAFAGKSKTLHWAAKLHLAPDGDDERDEKLYVTKVSDLKRVEQFPFESLVPFTLLRPILSAIAIFLSGLTSFYHVHSKDGIVGFTLAAAEAVITAVWGFLLAETGKRQAQAEQWKEKKGTQLDQIYSKAIHTASDTYTQARTTAANLSAQAVTTATEGLSELEARAKKAGIPVDEYKKQAEEALEELKKRAAEAVELFDAKTEEAKGEVEKAEKKLEGVAKEGEAKVEEVKETAAETTNDTPNADEEKTDDARPNEGYSELEPALPSESQELPSGAKTPLGGHDPTAPNAPSYAQAAQQ